MRRRAFLLFAATAPFATSAQQGRTPTIGLLSGFAESDPRAQAEIAAFRDGLKAHGWKEGENVRIEYRWGAGSPSREVEYARELVSLKPDVLMGRATHAV